MNTKIDIAKNYKQSFWKVATTLYPDFEVNDQNRDVIRNLLLYFTLDKRFNRIQNGQKYNLKKGILIIGNPGSGKSALMRIFQILMRNVPAKFGNTSIKNIAKIYETEGEIQMKPKHNMYYEDLNIINPSSYFGNQKNIPEELVYKRHDLYVQYGTITHFTSNESLDELADRYGLYIKDRLLEMCNILKLGDTEQYHSYRSMADKPTSFDAKLYSHLPTFFPTEYTDEEKEEMEKTKNILAAYERLRKEASIRRGIQENTEIQEINQTAQTLLSNKPQGFMSEEELRKAKERFLLGMSEEQINKL